MKSDIRYALLTIGLCALLMTVIPVRAGSVTINYVNGIPNAISNVATQATASKDMAGMTVTAYFSDLTWEQATWAQITGDLYGAVGAGWQLSVDDSDTFYAPWVLTSAAGANKTITKIEIDAGPGNAVFDVKNADNPLNPGSSTPGSKEGRTLEVVDETSSFDITVTYSDYVQLAGNSPVGDVWRRMGLDFTNAVYFCPGSTLKFMADTDTVAGIRVVPTPAEWSLLAMSLSVLSGYGLLKRRN